MGARVRLVVERVGTGRSDWLCTALDEAGEVGSLEMHEGESKEHMIRRAKSATHKRLQESDIEFTVCDITDSVPELKETRYERGGDGDE